MAGQPNPPIKFPVKTAPAPALTLRRRQSLSRPPFQISEVAAATRQSISTFVSTTRSPWGENKTISSDRVTELERSLRQLEALLTERERAVNEMEVRLAERERDLAEMEALILAREKLVELARKQPVQQVSISQEEKEALEQLKAELERQEDSLKEAKQSMREREMFLEESETKLFEKVQAQQEKEIQLDQKEEELRAKALRLREQEAKLDPTVAAALEADKAAAKKYDEFNE